MLVGLLVCKPHELFNMSAINPTKKTLEINQLGQQLDTTRTVLGIRTIGRSIPGKTFTDLHFELKREPKKISQGWLFPYLSRKKNIHSPISIAPEFPMCFLGIEPASPSARNSRTVLAAAWQHATESAGAQRLGATARDMESTVAFVYGRRVGIIMKYPTMYVHIQYIYILYIYIWFYVYLCVLV